MMLYDTLSLWEIAHRWHGHDPNLTNPESLPLEVQDTLRFLTRMMAIDKLRSCSQRGVKNITDEDIENYETVLSWDPDYEKMIQGHKDTVYEDYLTSMDRKLAPHHAVIDGLEKCFDKRIYDKTKLDTTYTLHDALAKLCGYRDIPLPHFWYPEGQQAQVSQEEELRPSQLAKQLCEAIASTLWFENPSLTIVQIIEHPAIQRFGNGAQYKDRTLRDWVKNVDPRPEDKRTGRPKKI